MLLLAKKKIVSYVGLYEHFCNADIQHYSIIFVLFQV